MKSTRTRILTIGAAVMLAVAIAAAQGPHGPGGPDGDFGHMLGFFTDYLDLSSAPFDETKTRALATANSQTQIELEVQHARIKAEMMQVLTADQKTKLANFEAKREARMKQKAPPAPPAD